MPLASHVELPERYRVTRHIASGGMASVWEVEDLLLGRIVAVKVLGAHYAADPRARARFQREARTAARVSDHPNIATIYDIGEHANDAFIVMEHFAGGTVADRLRAARERGERVPLTTALRWLHEAAAGLDVAHAAGIVHRDVKPGNLLLDAQNRLAVCDFGIARLVDDTNMTQTGQVLGTVAYLSPEQALGRPATAASDRYALAVVAYELLTGERPFDGGPPTKQLRQHAETPPPRASQTAPELPSAVDHVLLRGLAKDPNERPRTASTLVDDLERALTAREQTVQRTLPLAPLQPAHPPPQPAEPEQGATPAEPSAPPAPSPVPAPVTPAKPSTPPAPLPAPAPVTPAKPSTPRAPLPGPAPEPVRASARPRRSSLIALLAISAALAGGIVALALALTNTSPDRQRSVAERPTATQAARTAARPATTAPATSQPEPETQTQTQQQPQTQTPRATTTPKRTKPALASSSNPAGLNAKGFELNNAGRYGEAVEPLRASVAGYRNAGKTDDVNFAYALYNLGVALNRSGNHAAAIDVLNERMKYRNQLQTVRSELADARARLSGGQQKPGKSKAPPKGNSNADGDY